MPNLRAKKSLGQHFLTSPAVAHDMASAVPLRGKLAVEVGPGAGMLTEALLAEGAAVIAVEKDARAVPLLAERFAAAIAGGKLTLVEQDILEFDPEAHGLAADSYVLAGNIPYYISGALLRRFTDSDAAPRSAVLMVQQEVAERMTGRSGWSLLTVAIHSWGIPRIVKKVPARFFKPKPKVDSAIVVIERMKPSMPQEERMHLIEVARVGFAHKRKLLSGNLGAAFDRKKIKAAFEAAGIYDTARAEELTLPMWRALAGALV